MDKALAKCILVVDDLKKKVEDLELQIKKSTKETFKVGDIVRITKALTVNGEIKILEERDGQNDLATIEQEIDTGWLEKVGD